jgi:hypothetical protein
LSKLGILTKRKHTYSVLDGGQEENEVLYVVPKMQFSMVVIPTGALSSRIADIPEWARTRANEKRLVAWF